MRERALRELFENNATIAELARDRGTSDYTTVSFSSLSLAQITGMQLWPISQNVSRDLNAAKKASEIEGVSLTNTSAASSGTSRARLEPRAMGPPQSLGPWRVAGQSRQLKQPSNHLSPRNYWLDRPNLQNQGFATASG